YRSGNLLVRIVNMHVVVVPVDVDAVVRNVRRVLGDIGRVVVDDGRIVFGNRRRVVAVYVVAVDIRRVVVIVGDVGDVRNARVADVHVAEIIPARAVGRQMRLTIAQGARSDCRTTTHGQADAPVTTANPGDE